MFCAWIIHFRKTTLYLNQPISKPPKLNIVKRPIFPELNSAKNSWNPPTSPQNSILNSTQHSIHQTVHDSIHNASEINDQIGAQYNAKINGQNQASSSNSAQNQQPQNYNYMVGWVSRWSFCFFYHVGLEIPQKYHTFCEVFYSAGVVFIDLKPIFFAK